MWALLRRLDGLSRLRDAGGFAALDAHRQRAADLRLTTRPGARNPFDPGREPDRVRDRYGREEWGQGFLVARRLVEGGVRAVPVNLRGWDTHQNAFLRKVLPPPRTGPDADYREPPRAGGPPAPAPHFSPEFDRKTGPRLPCGRAIGHPLCTALGPRGTGVPSGLSSPDIRPGGGS
jgi:hypothetical protein